MFLEYAKDGQLWTSTGTLDAETSDGIIKFTGHMWIEDTTDGGASDFIPSVDGSALKRWLVAPEQSPEITLGWKDSSHQPRTSDEDAPLKVHCHCNTVQLLITRPNERSLDASSPFPDLTHPSKSAHSPNPNNEAWWISKDKKRYLAGTCACESCRLHTGFDIMSWSFVPMSNVTFTDGAAIKGTNDGLDSDPRINQMMGMVKSPTEEGTKRHFCRKCGATVFWWGSARPTLLDVAVGLIDAPTGVRCEEWLEWHGDRVSFAEEAFNKALIKGLAEGLREWKHGKVAEERKGTAAEADSQVHPS
ncbi:hypothetical protein NA57DRAFT_77371 [Rhizodiscina lignyota]|uniref:CENP-V/GFA domain-containing protein n=1 Tax=Rhizodiscina lignyota TaxID=1504668 RepID=A0A9P4I8F6_9PEZI|nr:hypothetical protein NA57DRAFT_77371 [Rhizodiscina lignyota]